MKRTLVTLSLTTILSCTTYADQVSLDQYLSLTNGNGFLITERLQPFVAIFEQLDRNQLERRINDAYAEKLYFNDTLVTLRSRKDLVDYLHQTEERASYVKTTILDVARSGENFYVRWLLEMEFEVLGSSKVSRSVGISHLKFNTAGKITLHQDFWDSGTGFYEHMPVLGGLIAWVKTRFQPEDGRSTEAVSAKLSSSIGK